MCFLCECYKTSDVTLVSEDDNDNSDVIVLKRLEKFIKGKDLQDALQCNAFYYLESTYVKLYGQWVPHLAELHEG